MTVKRSSPFQVPAAPQQQQHMPALKRARALNPGIEGSQYYDPCEASSTADSAPTVTPLLTTKKHPMNPFRQDYSSIDDMLDLSPLTLERAVTLEEEPSSDDDDKDTSAFNTPRFTLRMRPTFGSTNPFIQEALQDEHHQTAFLSDDEYTHRRTTQLLPPRMALDIRDDQDFVLETPRPFLSLYMEPRSPPPIQRHITSESGFVCCDSPLRDDLKLPMLA